MYEALTAFIPFMESGSFGDWSERVGDGTPENPYVMCHIDYNEQIIRLNHVLYDFEKAHDLLNFHEILKINSLKIYQEEFLLICYISQNYQKISFLVFQILLSMINILILFLRHYSEINFFLLLLQIIH